MHNLHLIRTTANIRPGLLTKYLNISAHTYLLYEKGALPVPYEILKMISIVFSVSLEILKDDVDVPEDIIGQQVELSKLTDDEKIKIMTLRMLPNGEKLNYRNIRKIKDRIYKETREKSEP